MVSNRNNLKNSYKALEPIKLPLNNQVSVVSFEVFVLFQILPTI